MFNCLSLINIWSWVRDDEWMHVYVSSSLISVTWIISVFVNFKLEIIFINSSWDTGSNWKKVWITGKTFSRGKANVIRNIFSKFSAKASAISVFREHAIIKQKFLIVQSVKYATLKVWVCLQFSKTNYANTLKTNLSWKL